MISHPFSLEKNRLFYFSVFFVSNALIAYSGLFPHLKVVIGLFGILLPLYVALRTSSPVEPKEKPGYLTDLKIPTPLWVWAAAIFLLVFLRFYQLTSFPRWPNLDEGWIGILAQELSRHWSWKFFYTFGETPPLTEWCVALLFKAGCSPAFCLWFPPAAVSLLTVWIGFLAARQFFSKSFSLACGGLLAFSLWPLFIGRHCHQGIWLPLWVCLFLFLWGKFQKASSQDEKRNWALSLGLGLGFGSFTFTPWLAVAGLLFLWVFWTLWLGSKTPWIQPKTIPSPLEREGRVNGKKYFLLFLTGFVFSLVPFCLAVFREGFGQHILSLSPWGGWFEKFELFKNAFKYFAVMLWGSLEKEPAYTPVWGGFLNPALGAFFFLGLVEMFRLRRQALIQWVSVIFILFLLPGALSPNLETFRTAQVLPLLLFITVLGVHAFLSTLSSPRRPLVLAVLLLFTAGLDFYLLSSPSKNPEVNPDNFGRPIRSIERYRAYRALELVQKKENVLFLGHFDAYSFNDPTLPLMTPAPHGEDLSHYRWVAVFANLHYLPFLEKRFPEAMWQGHFNALIPDPHGNIWDYLTSSPKPNFLGFIPVTPANQDTLRRWVEIHQAFRQADLERFFQNSGKLILPEKTLTDAYPLVQGDPFLESCYWDKLACYYYSDRNLPAQLNARQKAVELGYPTADLYCKWGTLLLATGRKTEAQSLFQKAAEAPMDRTPAKEILKTLKTQTNSEKPK